MSTPEARMPSASRQASFKTPGKIEADLQENKTRPRHLAVVPVEPASEPMASAEGLPRKGQEFDNHIGGGKLVVERVEKGDEGWAVYYTEVTPDGVSKHKNIKSKPLENFLVLTRTAPVQKDRRQHVVVESRGTYDEAMEKTARAFNREFEASEDALESWGEHIGAEYGSHLSDDTEAMEQKNEGQEIATYHALSGKINEIGNEWNTLDDRVVENGRRRIGLLAELRALESQMPEEALELKKEALEKLDMETDRALRSSAVGAAKEEPGRTDSHQGVDISIHKKSAKNKERLKKKAMIFRSMVKQLQQGMTFEKEGKPLLKILASSRNGGIDIEYKSNSEEKRWIKNTIDSDKASEFLTYLKDVFGWTLTKETTKVPEEKRRILGKKERDAGVMLPIDEGAAEQLVSQEWTYEALEAALPVVKKKQCVSVVSEGLSPFVQYVEKNTKVTLQELVEQAGIEDVVRNIVPSIMRILPIGPDLSEKERRLFASEFAKREILESLK